MPEAGTASAHASPWSARDPARRRPPRPPRPEPDPGHPGATAGPGQGSRAPRVLIADGEELVRTGFRLILTARGTEVIGEAVDGVQAVAEAERLRPDVLLTDIRMPNLDGLEAAERVLRSLPRCRVLTLTTFDLDHYVCAALAAGASGFLLKDVTAAHLAAAVRLVNTGDALLAPSITRRLVERHVTAR